MILIENRVSIRIDNGIGDAVFTVTDTKKAGNAVVHFGSVSGVIEVNNQVIADVDVSRRKAIGLNLVSY